jgi:hypothetical protein
MVESKAQTKAFKMNCDLFTACEDEVSPWFDLENGDWGLQANPLLTESSSLRFKSRDPRESSWQSVGM